MGPKFVGGIAQPFLNGFKWSGAQNLQKIRSYSLDTKETRRSRGIPVLITTCSGHSVHSKGYLLHSISQPYHSSVKVLWKLYHTSMKALWKLYENSMKTLPQSCHSLTNIFCKALPQFCESSVKALWKLYASGKRICTCMLLSAVPARLGLRWLWLPQTPGQAKAIKHGLA